MTYFVDIDNTICLTNENDYENAIPIIENIAKINRLSDEGHIIIYWSSRGNTSKRDLWMFTHNQLILWGCRFHSLQLGKPSFDFCIDDKNLRIGEL